LWKSIRNDALSCDPDSRPCQPAADDDGNWSRNPRSGMRPLPSIILANEDQLIWLEVSERFARGGNRYNLAVWVRADDRKDAATMLDNVRHHVSAVIQAQTGEWAYFCHGSVARGLWEMSF
jgi:hypothetical protein